MRARTGFLTLLLALLLTACANGPAATPPSDEEFLRSHGWTVAREVAAHMLTLPERFADEPGVFPIGLYWAYNNELSRSIGLDFSQYAGKAVTVKMYDLKETLPDGHPNPKMRAVVLRHEGKLIGAYLDRWGHYGFAASLDRRTFPEVVGKPFGVWLEEAKVVDWNHPAYREFAQFTPEQVIHACFEAIDRHDYARAYALTSLHNRIGFLFSNREREWLYNPNYEHKYGGLRNITRASVKGLGDDRDLTAEMRPSPELNRQPHEARQYGVSLDLTYAREISARSGSTHRFVTAVRETPGAPWLIDGVGTGP